MRLSHVRRAMSLRRGHRRGRPGARVALGTARRAPAVGRRDGSSVRCPAARILHSCSASGVAQAALLEPRRLGCVQGGALWGWKNLLRPAPGCGSSSWFEARPVAGSEQQDLHNPPPLECLPGRSTEGGKSWWCGTRQFARLRRGLRARTFHGRHRRATHSSRRCLRPFGQSPSERPGSQVTCGRAVLEGPSSLARLLAPFATALPRGPQVGTGRRHESRECPLSPRPRA